MTAENIYEVFISYSSKDEAIAYAVCKCIESNNIKCWIAPRDVIPGKKYPLEIINGIRKCSLFLLIYTSDVNTSEHVANEIELSFNEKKTIIPFLVDNTPMSDELKYYLSRKHWLAAYPNYQEKTGVLVSILGEYLGKENINNYHQSFLFVIEDKYYIETLKGVVVTGLIKRGSIRVGDKLIISGVGKRTTAVCGGIEMNGKIYNEANTGDVVGILLKEVNDTDIIIGQMVVQQI